jgi:hypothetical protein
VSSYVEWLTGVRQLKQGLATLAALAATLKPPAGMTADEAKAVQKLLADEFNFSEATFEGWVGFGHQAAEALRQPLGDAATVKESLLRNVEAGLVQAGRFLQSYGLAAGVVCYDQLPPQSRRLVDVEGRLDRQAVCVNRRFLAGELAHALDGIEPWQSCWLVYANGRPNREGHIVSRPVPDGRYLASADPILTVPWVSIDLVRQRTAAMRQRFPDGQPLPAGLRLG